MADSCELYLNKIQSPADLKKIEPEELTFVCNELRQFIIDVVSDNPGHFGASLGVVEITAALHYVFDTPHDKIVWDVGHQAYGHKILTGRKDRFYTNRKKDGISGYPRMNESEFDAFGVGHSSTSISAALGIAVASRENGENDRQVIAVIGDGSMTGGMAFEGLNNAGIQNTNILVVLNDNNMAIDPNVGALKEYLTDITTSQIYNKIRTDVWNILGKINKLGSNTQQLMHNIEAGIKTILFKHSNLFESLNFRYFGPVDGHDVIYLTKILEDLKSIPGPKLLHCVTKKGKGYSHAEENQTKWHAPGRFNKHTGEIFKSTKNQPQTPRYQDVFGHTILELARENDKIVGITPAMPSGCSLNIMMREMPDRTFDVGIAEQHAVTFSAGLATQGMLPFCNIYSSFMQRAYDQIIHDVALQNLNVVFCIDRAGLVGEDGPTHHGAYDLSYLRSIPNITIAAPMNELELRNLMYTAQLPDKGPFAIRYPRGNGVMPDWRKNFEEIQVGKGRCVENGVDLAVLSLGHIGNHVTEAVDGLDLQGISVAHYDMRFLKPLDEELLHKIFKQFRFVITIEDGTLMGGLGSAVAEFMCQHGYHAQLNRMGIPDKFIGHGTREELYKEIGLDVTGIISNVKTMIKDKLIYKVS